MNLLITWIKLYEKNPILDQPSPMEALNQELMEACYDGDLVKVKYCIEHGADIHYYGRGGHPPLYGAASCGKLEVVKYLVDQNANLEGRDFWCMCTPLLVALGESFEVVKFLVEKKANLEAVEMQGRTALQIAADICNIEMVKLLVESGANMEAKDKEGLTPIHLAAKGFEHGT